jgi:glycosyltransferase involved in cell wall biosynthesis
MNARLLWRFPDRRPAMSAPTEPRPKVLFVLPNFAGGGAERVALILLDQLDRAAFAPALAVLDDSGPLRPLLRADAALHVIGQPRLRRALPALLGVIRRERPAVVFATLGYLNIALLALRPLLPRGTRIALREANTPSQSLPHDRRPRLMAWAYRRFYPRADLLFCQHRQTAREMREDFSVPPARLIALPNPVPEARLRAAVGAPLRHPGQGLRFVAAGRLHRQKGFDRLIELFAGLPEDAHLTIYGEGPERSALAAQIRRLGMARRITLADFSDRLPAALAGADACVISSRWEGLPNVALEALAMGTPVIATAESGGIAELAETAPPGAVSVVPWGEAFASEMACRKPRGPAAPGPSLLPQRHALENVARIFNVALRELLDRDVGGD